MQKISHFHVPCMTQTRKEKRHEEEDRLKEAKLYTNANIEGLQLVTVVAIKTHVVALGTASFQVRCGNFRPL